MPCLNLDIRQKFVIYLIFKKIEYDISEAQPNDPPRQFNIENLVGIASRFSYYVAQSDYAGTQKTGADHRTVR